jgi:hypothetical protein
MMPGSSATVNAAARPAPQGERELKFRLPLGRVHIARRWLEGICARDAEFPAAVVWTIYYDTASLSSLAEKINSDYLKRKIRVRWYSDLDGRPSGPAFVEGKFRVGALRMKARERLPLNAEDLAQLDLQDPRLLAFPLLLRPHGVAVDQSWTPVMLIRYRRDRYIERGSQSRVSVDADIAAVAVNPRLISAADYSPLGSAVVEVKGTTDELPRPLHPLLRLGAHKQSFSKFLAVYAHVTRRIL